MKNKTQTSLKSTLAQQQRLESLQLETPFILSDTQRLYLRYEKIIFLSFSFFLQTELFCLVNSNLYTC